MKLSSKHQERLGQGNCTSFDGPVAPWCCYYPYFYMPMDYSRMHIQSYYIQYPSVYPNHASAQRPIVACNNLVKELQMRKVRSKIQSIYSRSGVLQTHLILKSEDYNICAKRKQWNNKKRSCQ